MDFVPAEKGVPIRQPATANLMIDSFDRNQNPGTQQPNPFDFQIQRNQSLLNGFFTRVGTTEVVLEWNEPNGAYLSTLGSTQLQYTSSSVTSTITIGNNFDNTEFYNASQAIEQFADRLNTTPAMPTGVNFFVSSIAGREFLFADGLNAYNLSTSQVSAALGLPSVSTLASPPPALQQALPIVAPDLRPFRYLDFTSEQLTYNQDLKDNSTAKYPKDVLCRWYMAWDQQPQRDALGFPIEMGYEPFKVRRLFNPPKQIRWDPKQPVGNLAFRVYGDNQPNPIQTATPAGIKGSQWLMTLQVSET